MPEPVTVWARVSPALPRKASRLGGRLRETDDDDLDRALTATLEIVDGLRSRATGAADGETFRRVEAAYA